MKTGLNATGTVDRPARSRLRLRLGAALLLILSLLALRAAAGVLPFAPGIRLITSQEVLEQYTEPLPSGDLLFHDAGGGVVRFVTDVQDPEIPNRGDGSFFPAGEEEVRGALSEVPAEFLRPLQVEIFLLPYPRAGRLSSSADSRAIYLSPGVRPYEPWQVAFLVTHELGHSLHRQLLPDTDLEGWRRWARLRGVADSTIYHADAAHADRPHEIFAEDFRVLFGGPLARGDGSIENSSILPPAQIRGLIDFYLELAGVNVSPVLAELRIGPNPLRAGQRLVLRLPASSEGLTDELSAGLHDVSGKRVAQLRFARETDRAWSLVFSGLDLSGRRLAAGAYWLRLDSASRRITVPLRVLR